MKRRRPKLRRVVNGATRERISADARLAAAEVLIALRAPLASHVLQQAFDAEKKAVLPTTTSASMQTMAHSNWKLCTPSSSARCCATCFACLRSA